MANLPDTRYTLLARLSDPNDLSAWSEFAEIYEDAIYRYSRSRGLQDSDAWEVVQHVLLLCEAPNYVKFELPSFLFPCHSSGFSRPRRV